jgi:hypothetical protein
MAEGNADERRDVGRYQRNRAAPAGAGYLQYALMGCALCALIG